MVVVSQCPVGYTSKDGNVPGPGLKGLLNASIEECKDNCDESTNCKSFIYSLKSGKCKLVDKVDPKDKKIDDYQFCSKNIPGIF